MAGMPSTVIERANELLVHLERSHNAEELGTKEAGSSQLAVGSGDSSLVTRHSSRDNKRKSSGYQLSFIQLDDPLLQRIKEDILNTDINTLTPVEALMKLNEIKKLLKG